MNSNSGTAREKSHHLAGSSTAEEKINLPPAILILDRIRSWLNAAFGDRGASTMDLKDAIEVCKRAAGMGWTSTISTCFSPGGNKASAAALCIRILLEAAGHGLASSLSFSPSDLRFDIHLFRQIAGAARNRSVRIYLHSATRRPQGTALEFLEESVKFYPLTGYTIDSSLRSAVEIAREVACLGIPVRVSASNGRGTGDKYERENCLKVIQTLSGKCPAISILTDDNRLARKAEELVSRTFPSWEFEHYWRPPGKSGTQRRKLSMPVDVVVAYRSSSGIVREKHTIPDSRENEEEPSAMSACGDTFHPDPGPVQGPRSDGEILSDL